MALSYPLFFTLYSIAIVVALFIAILVFVGWKDMWIRRTLLSAKYNAIYIILIAAFPLFVQAQDIVERHLTGGVESSNTVVYTNWIFGLAGGAIRILQDRLNYRILYDIFIVFYAWVFAYITYLAPLLLLVKDDRATLRHYSIAIMLNYLVLTPFYLVFPVSVSGSHPESSMTPLLYASSSWGKMVTSVDPLNNDFPSGHVSLSVTTFLVFAYAGPSYRKLAYLLGAIAAAIAFSVLYLGVHWPADVFAGFLLAVGATALARTDRVQMTIDRYVRRASRALGLEKGAPEPSSTQPSH